LLKPAFRFTKKKFKDDEFIHNNRNNRNVARGGRNRDEEERANEEEGQNIGRKRGKRRGRRIERRRGKRIGRRRGKRRGRRMKIVKEDKGITIKAN